MKIIDVEMKSYAWPRPRPIRNGKLTYTKTGINFIIVHTDTGHSGFGWGGTFASLDFDAIQSALLEYFKPLLIGEDPFNYRRIWENLWQPKFVGRRGLATQVISAIDIALWDLMGKSVGKSIHQLLGGYRDRVPVYVAGGYYEQGKGLDALAQEAREILDLHAHGFKIKIGGAAMSEDLERIRVVREALGPDVKLMVDANGSYAVHDAIMMARKMEGFDIYWFEEPVAPDNYRGHAQIAQSTVIPIATGENEYTRYGFQDLIEQRSASILNPAAQILGGITEFMQVAALASAYDLPVAPHGAPELHLHLTAAIPNGLMVEYSREALDPIRANVFEEKMQLDKQGYALVSDRPGLGLTPNLTFLEPYRLHPHL
jgi:L-alanine-DL-glutamate epimerase-like enolase superfamily enzyme